MKFNLKTTGVALLVSAMLAPVALAGGTVRGTSGFGPSHVMATAVYPATFKTLEELSGGEWKGRDTPSGLLSPKEMNAGLRDGVSDMGVIILPYFAADYPETGLVAELSMQGDDNRAISSAVTEYIVNCQECLAEFAKNGQVYLGSDSTTTYALLSRSPIKSLDDLKGKRVRTAGSVFTRMIEGLGAEAVQMPANELFEGLSQGVIDATYSSIPDLKNARLLDVVKNVTEINQGVFNAAAPTNVSRLFWDRLDNEEKTNLIKAAQVGQTTGLVNWRTSEAAAREEGKAAGISFDTPDDALIAAANQFREDHHAAVATTLEERGVKNAAEKVKRYQELVTKWTELVKGADTPEALADLRYQEIWSKVDLENYNR